MKTEQENAAPVSDEALLAAYATKTASLRQEERALLEQELEIDKPPMTVVPIERRLAPQPRSLAIEMLNGFAPPSPAAVNAGERLFEIQLRRRAIAIALDFLQRDTMKRVIIRTARLVDERGADWRALTLRRARALIAFRKLNAEAQKFRDDLKAAAGSPIELPLDFGWDLLRAPDPGDEGGAWLEKLVEAGVISAKDTKFE